MRPLPQVSFSSHPLALLAVSFALGIIAARFIAVPLKVCLIAVAVGAAAGVYLYARQQAALATLCLALAFCWAGAALALLETGNVSATRVQRFFDEGAIASGDPVEVTGVLTNAPERAPDSFYLTLRVEQIRFREREQAATGVVWLVVAARDVVTREAYERLELRYGARVRVMAALSRAETFRNPGGSSLTEYLERRGYDATATVKSPLLIERLDDERVFLPLAWIYEWRQFLLAEMAQNFSPETSGVLQAALLGNRHYLSQATAGRFRQAGTFHVLVISGLHISFIGGLVLLIMRRVTKRRGWQFIVSATFLWAYAIMVGAETAVVRAALMFTVVALGAVVARRARPLNALGCAALILLVWRPGDLFDASFQLTFLAVLLMVAVAWPLFERLRETGEWRPTQATPYPPNCPHWWRLIAEALFWSEREWQRELALAPYSCRLFKTPLAARLERWHAQRPLRYAVAMLLVSISVQAGLLPLLILYFHRLSLASFILNIFVSLLMALLSLVALAALLLSQASTMLAAPLFWLAELMNWLMVHSVDPFAYLGIAALRLPEYTGRWASLYLVYYIPLFFLAVALARWHPLLNVSTIDEEKNQATLQFVAWLVAVMLSATLVIIAHPGSAGRPDGRLRIDFLDVGQGDAALVTMPDGTTLLVDGGGRPQLYQREATSVSEEGGEVFERDTRSIGEAVVSEYLWWRGLDRVDYILATHADADHIDGLNDVARNFSVRAALVGRAPADDAEFKKFSLTMQGAGVPVALIGRGDVLRFGPVEASVLWPVRTEDPHAPSANNDSVVLSLRFGERVFLLTGDIEQRAEATLVAAPEELWADVVKVAHHGSKTSSTGSFVAATRPKLAVISVGLSSIFGHPHKEVTERWRAGGAEVLTTGGRGTITVSTDGHDLSIETYAQQ